MQTLLFYIIFSILSGTFSIICFTKISQYSVVKSHKVYIILFSFFVVIGLNYLLQPLLNYFFIDDKFFRQYPGNCLFYFMFLAILCYFITYLFYKLLYKHYTEKEKQLTDEFTQIKTMKEYTGQIEDLYLDIRGFKHDYVNILSSMHSYINDRNYEGLEKYFNHELMPAGSALACGDSVYGRLGFIQVPEIKSILYTKILQALKQMILVTTDIKEKFSYFPMNTLDLVRVLGILLDNAIESSALTNEKFLSITFLKDTENIYIQIQNSSSKIENVEELYEIQKSSKGEGRGVGLFEVRRIIGRYSNVLLNTEYNNFVFNQKLVLFIQDAKT